MLFLSKIIKWRFKYQNNRFQIWVHLFCNQTHNGQSELIQWNQGRQIVLISHTYIKNCSLEIYIQRILVRPYNINFYQQMNQSSTQNNIQVQSQLANDASVDPKQPEKQLGFFKIFRFSNKQDLLYMVLGGLCSFLIGGALPLFSLLWGNMTNSFKNSEEMVHQAFLIFIEYLVFGCIATLAGWGQQHFWNAAAQNQANECRKAFMDALLRQDIAFFQTQKPSEIVSKFVADSLTFQMAVGEKIALIIYLISMFISGLVISFLNGWELTLVILAIEPLLIFSFWFIMHNQKKRSQNETQIFQAASHIAQEAIQCIKVVKQLNGENHEFNRFQKKVNEINDKSFSFNIKMSLGESFCLFSLLFSFTLAFWFGSECVQGSSFCPQKSPNPYSGGSILTIFFCLLMPAVNLNQFTPTIKTINEGRYAAHRMFNIIDRQPAIKSGNLKIPKEQLKGVFKFQGVTFSYQKEKTKIIFQDLNLQITKNHSGLMGDSGCGKSTILQLLMRFYDPDFGTITLDGINLKDLDLHWLRQQIGYVGQQPLLLSTSIKQNLLIGKEGASQDEIYQALRQAEILDFVMDLSDKLESYVGNGGSQLSGGQKQRIAIARIFLKNPFILLLDEATSALDRINQRFIQDTLNKISSEKRSITVAHRLKTIKNTDQIFVCSNGTIIEQGKFADLRTFKNMNKEMEAIMNEQNYENQQSSPSKAVFQKIQISKQLNTMTTLPTFDSEKNLLPEPSKDAKNQQIIQGQDEKTENTYRKFLIYAKERKLLIFLGILSSIVTGVSVPSMGIHVARIVTFSLIFETNVDYYSLQFKRQCLYMLITCIAGGLAIGLQYHVFLNIGCKVVNKMRLQIFDKIIKLPLSWFEDKQNHSEQICVKLGADIYTINHILSRYFAHFCGALTQVVFGLLTAFYFEWRTALMSIGLIPLIGLVGIVQANIMSGYLNQSQGLYQQSAKMVTQAVNNMKTVISFCYENTVIKKYGQKLEEITNQQFKKKLLSGFVFGFTYFILFTIYGVLFYVSTIFIRNNDLDITNAFSAILLVLFSGIMAGNNIKYIPDFSLLKTTGGKLFQLINQLDEDQIQTRKGSTMISKDIEGNIVFKNVCFRYDNREQSALKSISFEIKKGEKVGIVGSSGCGKSTILKLLLGFYNCSKGEIFIDGVNIEDYNIHSLREHFGVVSQEPQLFDDTVQYNIVYNRQETTNEEIHNVAKRSNLIKAAILDNPETTSFLQRKVGPRGSHLSGGQKQRIAIAQSLLRNPKLLLFDQATSALDQNNQIQVQQVLKEVSKEKTVINVTHKLEQLQDFTKIIVLEKGQVIEIGSYNELMDKKKKFYNLLHGLSM